MTAPSSLASRFPRTVEALSAFPGALDHLLTIESGFVSPRVPITIAEQGPGSGEMDFDVALAGGGLSLIYGAWLARAGLRVVIFDRGRIGQGHREWNISRRELRPLVDSGLFTDAGIDPLIVAEYDHGIVRWHGGDTHVVREVLDCAVASDALLRRLRALAEAAGATLLDGHTLRGYRTGTAGVAVDLATVDGNVSLTTRLLVDAMGAHSPHARFDLACPTVGGVLSGLDQGTGPGELDPRVGEILVSTEGVEDRRQHIWEGFPGPHAARDGRSTVYLFYYAEPDTLGPAPLFSLYERFFTLRARYKRGPATLEKPTYGVIPGYTRLRAIPTSPADRVLLVGDAAGRHSPLTYCGFGSMIRSFLPVGQGIRRLVAADRLDRRSLASLWREPPSLRLLGALALMMIPPGGRGANGPPVGDTARSGPVEAGEINRLLDVAFGTLAAMGQPVFSAMVRDEIRFADFARFMLGTARRRPTIYREVFQHLTPTEIATWSTHFAMAALR